jgi:hypothetical protein
MYHLLIERVSTVMIEFLQYRARVRIGLKLSELSNRLIYLYLYVDLSKLSTSTVHTQLHNSPTKKNLMFYHSIYLFLFLFLFLKLLQYYCSRESRCLLFKKNKIKLSD